MEPEQRQRIERELAILKDGGLSAELVGEGRTHVLYHNVPTAGDGTNLPGEADIMVPVPAGYPATAIDLAGLPTDSPLLARVMGGANIQGVVHMNGREFKLASYHPHGNGGGPPWDPRKHGFHTYLDHLIAWVGKLT